MVQMHICCFAVMIYRHNNCCNCKCTAKLPVQVGCNCLQVLLNEKAQEVASKQYKLSTSGRTISADKVYVCIGGKPNTAFLQNGASRSILDQRGYVKVRDVQQLCCSSAALMS